MKTVFVDIKSIEVHGVSMLCKGRPVIQKVRAESVRLVDNKLRTFVHTTTGDVWMVERAEGSADYRAVA